MVIFHLLDIQTRDVLIESEDEEKREIIYEYNSDEDDEGVRQPKKKEYKQHDKQRELIIHLFGVTEAGQRIRCDVTGFRPTIYLRLPEERTSTVVDGIKTYINSQGIPMGSINIKRTTKKIFYGFTAGTQYPFLEIDVPSLSMFRSLRGLFLDDQLRPATKRAVEGVRGKPTTKRGQTTSERQPNASSVM